MAFVALGVAMAFLSSRAWWHRLIMVVMAIPIALVVNIARVTTICILFAKVDPALAEGYRYALEEGMAREMGSTVSYTHLRAHEPLR